MTKKGTRRDGPPPTLRAYLKGPPKVSQRALADALGINQSMVSMLMRGKRRPSAERMRDIHAITGVPLAALLNMAPEPEPRKRQRPKAKRPPPARRSREVHNYL